MIKTEIRTTASMGQGLFALEHIGAEQVILTLKGRLLNKKETYELPDIRTSNFVQIGKDAYLDMKDYVSFFANHSCNPNCFVKIFMKTAFLVSSREIKPGEELFYDYSLVSNEEPTDWSMDCACREWNCRKNISGYGSISEERQKEYLGAGRVPGFVQ